MKSPTTFLLFTLALCAVVNAAETNTPETTPAMTATSQASISWPAGVPMLQGKVQAMIVVGEVNLVARDGTTTPLKRGQTFEEGTKIVASQGANALLVFSNGATLKVKEGTVLEITHFVQAPFDTSSEGIYLRLTRDPSRSNVVLNLIKGSLQGEVKKLNEQAGSTITVDSPAGTKLMRNGNLLDVQVVEDKSASNGG